MEEVNVQASGNNADIPTRGVALIGVVKSGGNDFHGGAWWSQTSKRFQSDNIDDNLAAKGITDGNPILKRRDDSGETGGRILRDKLWFYGSARERIDSAQVLGTFRPDGSPSVEDNRQWFLVGKLSYQMTKSNRFIGFYQHSRKHLQTGGSVNILPEAGYDQFQYGRITKAEWQARAREFTGHVAADGTLAMGRGLYRHRFARLEQDVRVATTRHNGPRDAAADRTGAQCREHPRREEVSRQGHD